MLRHGCGYALANQGHDTRALQDWLGHKSIQHTVRYTAELHLRPFQITNLDSPQTMPIGDQDQRAVTVSIAAIASRQSFRPPGSRISGAERSFATFCELLLPCSRRACGIDPVCADDLRSDPAVAHSEGET
jgi:type 1 fimbriae regulatory protein FimB/type 1 fimbriae regulatory protein FimE